MHKEIMTNNVYVCGTMYHVFISTLKNIEREQKDIQSLLIVNDHTPNLVSIARNLVKAGFFSSYCYVPFFEINERLISETGFFTRLFRRNKNIIEYVENMSGIKKQFDFINKSDINVFYSLGISSVYFLLRFKDNRFFQLEDGLRNYNAKVTNLKAFKRKFLLNTPQGEGRDDQIKTIEVQHPEKLPEVVRKKGIRLNLHGLINSLSERNRQEILNIFGQNITFSLEGNKKVLLITQPLSEDGFMTEEYKINLYNKILRKYASGYEVYIKPHPREKTIYKDKLDFNTIEIPRNFPLEILNFYPEVIFEKGITIFSGAIKNINNINESIFLGQDYDKKLTFKRSII